MLLSPGAKVIFVGVGTAAVVVGLLLLQPVRPAKKREIDKTAQTQETNRRMHPPRLDRLHIGRASLCICWKTFSVEASRKFSKGRPRCLRLNYDAHAIVDDVQAACYI